MLKYVVKYVQTLKYAIKYAWNLFFKFINALRGKNSLY